MLGNQEQDRLVDLLVATAEVIGDQLSPNAAAYMVSDLAQYPLPMLERALASCRRELKARLSLAAILERIEDGHPAPNEAWANAIRAADEGATVVWTEQTRDAWAAALPLVQAGDKIAARPAFLEVYTRLVKEARAAHRTAAYQLSLGADVSGRDSVLQQAVAAGQLTHERVSGSLDPAWFTRWATGSWERSNLIIQDARVPRGMRAMVHYANGGQAVNSQVLTAQQVPAEPGKSYMGSVYCNSYLGRSNISVFFVDANGNLIGSEFASSASRKYGANGSLSDYERLFVLTGPAPANASTVWLQIATTKESAAGQDCAGWYVQPMLEQCPPDASLPSLWSAGGGEALAQWGVAVRADRKVGGVQLTATGEISAFDVLADMFRVSSPSAGMRTEYSDGNWRVYDQNGRLRMRWGVVP